MDIINSIDLYFRENDEIYHGNGTEDKWIQKLNDDYFEILVALVGQKVGTSCTHHKFNVTAWKLRFRFLEVLKIANLLTDLSLINEHLLKMNLGIMFTSKTKFRNWLKDKHLNIFDFLRLIYQPFKSTKLLAEYSYKNGLVYPLETAKTSHVKELLENIGRYRRQYGRSY